MRQRLLGNVEPRIRTARQESAVVSDLGVEATLSKVTTRYMRHLASGKVAYVVAAVAKLEPQQGRVDAHLHHVVDHLCRHILHSGDGVAVAYLIRICERGSVDANSARFTIRRTPP